MAARGSSVVAVPLYTSELFHPVTVVGYPSVHRRRAGMAIRAAKTGQAN